MKRSPLTPGQKAITAYLKEKEGRLPTEKELELFKETKVVDVETKRVDPSLWNITPSGDIRPKFIRRTEVAK